MMSIKFLPSEIAKRMMPKKAIEKAVTQKLSVNRTAIAALARSGVLSKKTLTSIALKVVKSYKKTLNEELDAGASLSEAKDLALNDKKLIVQRVQNASIQEISKEIQEKYAGEFARWLPSDAVTPDPLHQLNYGKTYRIGVGINGEEPGDRWGCRCGLQILVNEDKLEL